jgi:hypothetical protein
VQSTNEALRRTGGEETGRGRRWKREGGEVGRREDEREGRWEEGTGSGRKEGGGILSILKSTPLEKD